MLQFDVDRLGKWEVENAMKINPGKSKAVRFTRRDQRILKASSCKNLEIILHRDLSWVNQVNYTVQKAWKKLHFIMCVLKKGNSNMKRLASSH